MATLQSRITSLATGIGNYIRDSVLPRLVSTGGTTGHVLTKLSVGFGWVAPSADPWTYLKLAADQDISTATWTDLTGLTFTPDVSSDYEVEFSLLCQTPTATTGARPGVSWSANLSYGAVALNTPSSAAAETLVHATIGTSAGVAQAAVGGLPTINVPFRHSGFAHFRSGSGTQGPFKLQMASEVALTAIRTKAGSYLKYRKIS